MTLWGFSTDGLDTALPFAMMAVVTCSFVFRCRLSHVGRLGWLAFAALACSRIALFRLVGDMACRCPLRIPELLVHVVDVLYYGTLFLAVLSVPFFFWRSRLKAFVLPVLAYSVALAGVLNAVATPVVREYVVASDRVPPSLDGYRIVHISDIHAYCGCRRWHTQKIVDVANGLNADLVCLTGDYVDGRPDDCAAYLEPLRGLRARDGVYAVTGNHEFVNQLNPSRAWAGFYADWGIPFLRNACAIPHAGLALGGVDDERCTAPYDRPDVAKAFAAATNGEFRVLLQHRPNHAEENMAAHGVGLQLSGHLHGGFSPLVRCAVADNRSRFVHGLYEVKSGVLCVSAGCGPLYGFPLRYRTPLEVGLVTLRHAPPHL